MKELYSKQAQLRALDLRIKYFATLDLKAEVDRLAALRKQLLAKY